MIAVAVDERTLWRTYAGPYHELYRLHPVRNLLQQVIAAGQLHGARRVLDIGCGVGLLLRALRDCDGSLPPVVGLDSSPEMLGAASLLDYPSFEAVERDLDLPAASWGLVGRFDRIVANNVLYALADPTATLRQLCEVASADARLVASTPRVDPDLNAVLADHLRAFAAAGGDPVTERERIMNSPLAAINRDIAASRTFHFPDEASVLQWFGESGWAIRRLETTYAEQNWLVVATRTSQ